MRGSIFAVTFCSVLQLSIIAAEKSVQTGDGGFLGGIFKRTKDPTILKDSGLSANELNAGIKEALGKGLQAAVTQLGHTNGFLTNINVRIPLPEQLRTIERGLTKIGQGAVVADFETTLNRAAEQAVPAATEVFARTLKEMPITDAANLLTAKSSTAVTDYFRAKSGRELSEKFLPTVKEWTGKTGVTSGYKEIINRGGASRFGSIFSKAVDIDSYVTDKALDGLFLMIAEEEKRIRANPQARTTELLEKVFGSL